MTYRLRVLLQAMALTVLLAAMAPAQAAFVLISDFTSLARWGVGGGGGASIAGSSITQVADVPVGAVAPQSARMTYALSSANAFNYIDFYNDRETFNLSNSRVDLWLKGSIQPNYTIALQLYSTATNGFLQHDFGPSELDGGWNHLSIALSDFADYGTSPDPTRINLVRFRVIGDAAQTALTDSFLVNRLGFTVAIPEPGALSLSLLAIGVAALARRRLPACLGSGDDSDRCPARS